ncbi:MAG TPA: universal stress protein [Promineifilum sp.]|nr:universal stress protein [Promineifilum sp.]HQF71857.1 universal stress protein [Promineifilum sp.]
MYKTILVPLDGSSLAETILPHVEELAGLCGASVIFLNVVELPHIMDKGVTYEGLPQKTATDVEAEVDEARRYLDELTAREAARGLQVRGEVEHGPVVATILRVATANAADLIAMASHGRGGLTEVYYGSVAAGILQRIDRPLLIVRGQ